MTGERFDAYAQGTVSMGKTMYQSNVLDPLFKTIKSGKAYIYSKEGGETPTMVGEDARFQYQKDAGILDYLTRISGNGVPNEYILLSPLAGNGIFVKGSTPYAWVGGKDHANGPDINDNGSYVWGQEQMAHGNLDFAGGNALINELGTEAIVTPYGTVTSLPSHTGVIPADITKNLWELGEIAPMIQKQLLGSVSNDMSHKVVWGNDESFNIGVMNMTLSADSSFDIDAFVDAMKTHIALNKNNKR